MSSEWRGGRLLFFSAVLDRFHFGLADGFYLGIFDLHASGDEFIQELVFLYLLVKVNEVSFRILGDVLVASLDLFNLSSLWDEPDKRQRD